jgi:hypothetical protein
MIEKLRNIFNPCTGCEQEYEVGDYRKVKELVKKIKTRNKSDLYFDFTFDDLQLQSNYPKLIEKLLKK